MKTNAVEEPLSLDQAFIKKLTDIILANLDNAQFGVEKLSCQMGMSHTTIHRKLRSYTHLSLSQFIREVRLQEAHEMLVQNLGNVSEISYRVGFGSPTYFNKCFHEYYGYPPGDVIKIEKGIIDPKPDKPDLLHLSELHPGHDKTTASYRWKRNFRNFLAISMAVLGGPLLIWVLYSAIYKNIDTSAETKNGQNSKSIAVLPFKNLSGDADNQYFADGVTIDIRDHLSRIKVLKVISGTTSDHFRGSTLTIPESAKKLGVNYILEGSARKDDNRTRVSVKLVDAENDRQLLSETFDRELSDIFSVQSEIAQKVAGILEAVLSDKEIEQIEKIPTKSTEAHILYLKGRYSWNLRTKESLITSSEYFEKSIAADPGYTVAYAGLADAYYTLAHNNWIPVAEGFRKAKEIAQKALEIDPGLAEAHAIIGGVYAWGEWQWEKARKEYQKAIELNPNYSTAYFYYAELLDLLGENEEARLQLNNALELDPLSRAINYNNMVFYYNQGKFNEALEAWNDFNEMGLAFFNPYAYYFYIYMYLGEDSLAYETYRKFLDTNTEGLESNESFQQTYEQSGPKGILQWMSDQIVDISEPSEFYFFAKRCAVLGNNSEALDGLEKAFRAGYVSLPYIYNSYDFRNLRNEPRFRAILRKMNFPEYKSQTPGSY
jgi:TolB-like protein/AraC-like DNA-binding protein